MHGSIWHLGGDPDDLLPRYDALLAARPAGDVTLHMCMRAPDGLVIVDTCPSEQAFRSFVADESFAAALERHGLPYPDRLDDFAVHVAIAAGTRVAG